MSEILKTIIICLALCLLWIYPVMRIVKARTNTNLCPSTIVIIVWSFVICLTFVYSSMDIDAVTHVEMGIYWFTILSTSIIFSAGYIDKKYFKDSCIEILSYNSTIIKRTIVVCWIFRALQLLYDLYVIRSLGGNFYALFSEAQGLRFAYLYYSRNRMTLLAKVISNVLNYVAELGVIIASIEGLFKKKYWKIIITMALSFMHTIFTMSKLAFFLDLCFLASAFVLFLNSFQKQKESQKDIKRTRRIIIIAIIAMIVVLSVTGTQRGYNGRESKIDGIENINVSKTLSYFISPYMAFEKLVDQGEVKFSFGGKTFNPIAKVLGVDYENFGAIDVGIDDTTVYTMPGMFFADFGLIGSAVMFTLFIYFSNRIFKRAMRQFSIANAGLYCVVNTMLIMSFFTWMGRMTFFWVFPVFILLYDTVFLRKPGLTCNSQYNSDKA